ncbi:MAG: glycosyltransferase family 4 protein [Terrimicrobiaceae bacterium]|nr:glycosyltransferase family 4 protein [Terrimicrobiaceae bacterium]
MRFAYLFERFPTFTQTFCVREVRAVRGLCGDVPVYSIRRPTGEPEQDFPDEVRADVTDLPDDIEEALGSEPAGLGTRVRRRWALWRLREEKDRKRVYEALWLGPLLRARGIGHVHVHFAGLAARTAWWLKKEYGITFSVTAHANDFFVGANDKSPVQLADIFREAKFVATVSDFSRRLLAERFPFAADRILRIYNGIEMERFAGPREPVDPPLVLAVGRYIEKKGFRYLVEACSRVPEQPLRCVIVGGGPLDAELRELVAKLGQEVRVEIAGPMPERDIIALLRKASVFVLPCVRDAKGDSDNLPTVIMEAMAAGVPCISTPVAGVPEMIADGATGFLVPEADPQALANRLSELLADRERASAMGEAGRALCAQRFAIGVTSAQLAERLRHV